MQPFQLVHLKNGVPFSLLGLALGMFWRDGSRQVRFQDTSAEKVLRASSEVCVFDASFCLLS